MKRIITALMVLVLAGVCFATGTGPRTPATTILRITDGIGWQYKCVSSSIKNQYGFDGVGDTLTSDSTVSRGTLMNIKRVKESNDPGLSELLPIFVSSQTQLDSSYLYSKWSAPIWGLNNYYASVGGLNGWQGARPDSGRFSPYFARVARANGVYLSAKSVYPPGNYGDHNNARNFGSAVFSSDSTLTYSDSMDIDSTIYGPVRTSGSLISPSGSFYIGVSGSTATGTCTLVVYGANQSLIHGRTWKHKIDSTTTAVRPVHTIAGDSIYSIDSVKAKTFTSTFNGNLLLYYSHDRTDSL